MSEVNGVSLLKKLGSGVTPTERLPGGGNVRIDDFAALLGRAAKGEVNSGLTVTVEPSLDLNLDRGKIEVLSHIADQAQARGVQRVLVRDGVQQYILDVERRVIVERMPASGRALVAGIDAVVDLASEQSETMGAEADSRTSVLRGQELLQNLGLSRRTVD